MSITFEAFSNEMTKLNYEPKQHNKMKHVFVVKTKNGFNTEINTKSDSFIVSGRANCLDLVIDKLTASGFKLKRKVTSYVLFDAEPIGSFVDLINLVETIPGQTKAKAKAEKPAKVKAEKPVKEPKVKVAKAIKVKAEPKVESQNLSDDAVAKIKAANLKKMKEITAKKKFLPGQFANPDHGPGDGPVRTPAQAKAWIKAEEKRMDEEMRERDYPTFLSKDQAKLLVG